jgi:hypothetical protein
MSNVTFFLADWQPVSLKQVGKAVAQAKGRLVRSWQECVLEAKAKCPADHDQTA